MFLTIIFYVQLKKKNTYKTLETASLFDRKNLFYFNNNYKLTKIVVGEKRWGLKWVVLCVVV